MDRTRALDRRHRRILGAGIAFSVAIHAAAFAGLRFPVPDLARTAPVRLALLPPEDEGGIWLEATKLVETAPAQQAPEPLDFDAGGEPGAGGAPPPPRGAAMAGGIDAPVAPVGDAAFNPLQVLDPFTNGRVSPVAFGDLPEAEFTVAGGNEDDDAPIYVPGSIGQAKRNWAKGSGSGNGDAGKGRAIRIGLGGTGGGHCPMPGSTGRPRPPVWKLAALTAS